MATSGTFCDVVIAVARDENFICAIFFLKSPLVARSDDMIDITTVQREWRWTTARLPSLQWTIAVRNPCCRRTNRLTMAFNIWMIYVKKCAASRNYWINKSSATSAWLTLEADSKRPENGEARESEIVAPPTTRRYNHVFFTISGVFEPPEVSWAFHYTRRRQCGIGPERWPKWCLFQRLPQTNRTIILDLLISLILKSRQRGQQCMYFV